MPVCTYEWENMYDVTLSMSLCEILLYIDLEPFGLDFKTQQK